jgi:hypothetical protein
LAGNRARAALLRVAQAKTEVGEADDEYEREADQAAAEVVERLYDEGVGQAGPNTLDPADPADPVEPARVSRRLQRAPIGAEGGDLDAETEAELHGAAAGGAPLPGSIRRAMETAFDADFSGVRLHRDATSANLNRQLSARAFTAGRDIFLGHETPDLGSRAGGELLAHELTHTIQQGAVSSPLRRAVGNRARFGHLSRRARPNTLRPET